MTNAAELRVLLTGDASGANTALDSIGSKAGGLGKALAGAGIGAAAGMAAQQIAGIGIAFDDAGDALQIATGKSGAELDALTASLKNVAGTVPDDLGTVSSAMGELAARTGQTGPELEALTTQVLNLARMTGGDATASVANLTRMLGDASVPTNEQAAALDTLFKASQATGVSTDRLSGLMTSFGAPMRNLGMSFEESAALLGRFEKEGVNTELVMGALKSASAKWAEAGKKPAEGLAETIAKIQELGPSADATALAMETFGMKAGGDMVDTILGGKFAIDDYVTSIAAMPDGINATAEATNGMQEKFDLFKNKLVLMAEPLAGFGANIAPFVTMLPAVGGAIGAVVPMLGTLGTTMTATVIPAAMSAASAFAAMILPILPIVIAIGAVIAIGVLLYKNWDEIKVKAGELGAFLGAKWEEIRAVLSAAWDAMRAKIGEVWESIKTAISDAVAAIGTIISAAWGLYVQIITTEINLILTVVTTVWNAIRDAITLAIETIRVGISEGWTRIKEFLTTTLDAIATIVSDAWAAVTTAITDALDAIRETVTTVWDAIQKLIGDAVEFIRSLLDRYVAMWQDVIDRAMTAIQGAVDKVFGPDSGISAVVNAASVFIWGILDALRKFISGDFTGAFTAAKDAIVGAWDLLKQGVEKSVDAVVTKVTAVWTAITDLVTNLTGVDLAALMQSVVAGMARGVDLGKAVLKTAWNALIDMIPGDFMDKFKIASPSLVFVEFGKNLVGALEIGIRAGFGGLRDAMSEVIEIVAGAGEKIGGVLTPPGTGMGAASAWTKMQQMMMPAKLGRAEGPWPGDLMRLIQEASSRGLGRSGLGQAMKAAGFDDETIESYMDLHKMRGPKGWLTDEARALFERRRTGRAYGRGFSPATGAPAIDLASMDFAPDASTHYAPPEGVSPGRHGTSLAGTAAQPLVVRFDNSSLDANVKIELRDKVEARVIIGQREFTAIAAEVVRILETKFKLTPVPGTP